MIQVPWLLWATKLGLTSFSVWVTHHCSKFTSAQLKKRKIRRKRALTPGTPWFFLLLMKIGGLEYIQGCQLFQTKKSEKRQGSGDCCRPSVGSRGNATPWWGSGGSAPWSWSFFFYYSSPWFLLPNYISAYSQEQWGVFTFYQQTFNDDIFQKSISNSKCWSQILRWTFYWQK